VVEVQPQIHNTIDGSVYQDYRKGEATLVDFGDGRIVLALLEGNPPWRQNPTIHLMERFGIAPEVRDGGAATSQLAAIRGQRSLTIDQLPYLITFQDAMKPETYKLIDPHDLPASLGPDVTFVSATVEITDALIGRNLKDRLPWLKADINYLSGLSYNQGRFITKYQLIRE
jgi:hypothetical protein